MGQRLGTLPRRRGTGPSTRIHGIKRRYQPASAARDRDRRARARRRRSRGGSSTKARRHAPRRSGIAEIRNRAHHAPRREDEQELRDRAAARVLGEGRAWRRSAIATTSNMTISPAKIGVPGIRMTYAKPLSKSAYAGEHPRQHDREPAHGLPAGGERTHTVRWRERSRAPRRPFGANRHGHRRPALSIASR